MIFLLWQRNSIDIFPYLVFALCLSLFAITASYANLTNVSTECFSYYINKLTHICIFKDYLRITKVYNSMKYWQHVSIIWDIRQTISFITCLLITNSILSFWESYQPSWSVSNTWTLPTLLWSYNEVRSIMYSTSSSVS